MNQQAICILIFVFWCTMAAWVLPRVFVDDNAAMFRRSRDSEWCDKYGETFCIDAHFKDMPIQEVLRHFQRVTGRRIVVWSGVQGTITADLYSVDHYDAIAAVLEPHGYGWREMDDGSIHVYIVGSQNFEWVVRPLFFTEWRNECGAFGITMEGVHVLFDRIDSLAS